MDTVPATATVICTYIQPEQQFRQPEPVGLGERRVGFRGQPGLVRIDVSTNNHSGDAYNATGWAQATGTTTWSASVTGLTEGLKKLWVKTLDNAGNVTSAATALATAVSFTVDLTPPVLDETNIGAATVKRTPHSPSEGQGP